MSKQSTTATYNFHCAFHLFKEQEEDDNEEEESVMMTHKLFNQGVQSYFLPIRRPNPQIFQQSPTLPPHPFPLALLFDQITSQANLHPIRQNLVCR